MGTVPFRLIAPFDHVIVSSKYEHDIKHLIDAQSIGIAIAEASAQVFGRTLQERQKYERDEPTSEREVLNIIAATMSNTPPEFAKNLNMEVLMLHNSLIAGIASVMARHNQEMLAIVHGLLREQE